MYKKKILTMSLAVGLGALTVFGIGKEISIYADTVQRIGDVNNDGLINAIDATYILTEYAKISTGGKGTFSDVQKTLADIDKNGFIDAVDATYVLSYYAYISTGGQLDIEKWKESHNNNTTTTTTTDTTTTVTTAYTTTTTTVTTLTEYIATTVVTTENTTSTVATSDTTASTVTTDSTATSDTTASTVTTDSTATSDTTASTSATTDTATTSSTEISQTTTTVTTVTSSVTSSETVTTATTVSSGTPPTITGITLTRYDIDIPIGGKDISYVVMYPENAVNKDEIWTTSDEKVATVDGLGYITGISEGSCIVTVTSADNPAVKAEIKVTVRKAQEKVQEIKLSKYNMNLAVGGKDFAEVTMLPETVENKNAVWFTSDYDVATVDPFGNITGVSAGTCIVTVTSVSNPEVTANITVVVGADDKINQINLSKTEMNIPVGGTDISYVTMLPESVANKDEIWTTSDEKIAVV
ncbi:MAG: Ig-like domain-containing protein, partial [Ruminococcus sp.]|nr:Ig-like domain-containing protein [Ruminococcus sp.]